MLNSEEMWAISAEISSKYAPLLPVLTHKTVKNIALTRQELLDISQEVSRKFRPKLTSAKAKLVLMPIDTSHLYVSWNLGKTIIAPTPAKQPVPDMVLRISPQPEDQTPALVAQTWFDIKVDPQLNRQTITLPEEYRGKSLVAMLGEVEQNQDLTVYAQSTIVSLPAAGSAANTVLDHSSTQSSPLQAFSAHQNKSATSR